ncbi:Protoglobin-domain-containing protein [Desarmillaria ectypa]|nr:Protoglobin-domain-containing protein [Desarmillaria ectypa]
MVLQHVDPATLDDLQTRVQYLRNFIGFTQADADVLHAAKPIVDALVPDLVDRVYNKLLSFDITAAAFTPKQTGQDGDDALEAKADELNHDHPNIQFRKDFLRGYLVKLVSLDYNKPETWVYLDKVGVMHTGVPGFAHRKKKPALRVEYIHCALLLGLVEDMLVDAVILHPDIDLKTKHAVCRAVNKLLWIQNDLFARHYLEDEQVTAAKLAGN